jgi:hypothetical protein
MRGVTGMSCNFSAAVVVIKSIERRCASRGGIEVEIGVDLCTI